MSVSTAQATPVSSVPVTKPSEDKSIKVTTNPKDQHTIAFNITKLNVHDIIKGIVMVFFVLANILTLGLLHGIDYAFNGKPAIENLEKKIEAKRTILKYIVSDIKTQLALKKSADDFIISAEEDIVKLKTKLTKYKKIIDSHPLLTDVKTKFEAKTTQRLGEINEITLQIFKYQNVRYRTIVEIGKLSKMAKKHVAEFSMLKEKLSKIKNNGPVQEKEGVSKPNKNPSVSPNVKPKKPVAKPAGPRV